MKNHSKSKTTIKTFNYKICKFHLAVLMIRDLHLTMELKVNAYRIFCRYIHVPYLRYPPPLHALLDWWDIRNVTCCFRGQTSDKICQCKKSRSNLFILSKRGLIEMQNVRFRQVLRHYCLLWGHVRSLLHPKLYQWSLPPKICHYRL